MGRKAWVPTVSGPLAPMLLRAKGSTSQRSRCGSRMSTQTTHIYEHADQALKEQAIARTAPLGMAEMNRQVLANLNRIITALEQDRDSANPSKVVDAD
jgi:hypothetical protein